MHLPVRFDRRRLLLLAVVFPVLVAGSGLGWMLFFGTPLTHPAVAKDVPAMAGADADPAAANLPAAPGLLVHVSGAVEHPGLHRLNKGDRVYAAIEAAGGLSAQADTDRLPNLAGRLRDGEQVKVPFKTGPAGARSSGVTSAATNLNQAALAELLAVPGFDSSLAAAVVAHRETYGGFASTRELVTLLGMSEAAYSLARKHLRV
jgi:competence protein ComEA